MNAGRLERASPHVDGNRCRNADGSNVGLAKRMMYRGAQPPNSARHLEGARSQSSCAAQAMDDQQPFDWSDMLPVGVRGIDPETLIRPQDQKHAKSDEDEEGMFQAVQAAKRPSHARCHDAPPLIRRKGTHPSI